MPRTYCQHHTQVQHCQNSTTLNHTHCQTAPTFLLLCHRLAECRCTLPAVAPVWSSLWCLPPAPCGDAPCGGQCSGVGPLINRGLPERQPGSIYQVCGQHSPVWGHHTSGYHTSDVKGGVAVGRKCKGYRKMQELKLIQGAATLYASRTDPPCVPDTTRLLCERMGACLLCLGGT